MLRDQTRGVSGRARFVAAVCVAFAMLGITACRTEIPEPEIGAQVPVSQETLQATEDSVVLNEPTAPGTLRVESPSVVADETIAQSTSTSTSVTAAEPTATATSPTTTAAPTTELTAQATTATAATTNPPSDTHPDIVQVVSVKGRNPGGDGWKDSYSVGQKCYCATTYDHNIGGIQVDTPAGKKTVREVCEKIGDGPGPQGRPIYNDIQCGNGPANDAGDEDDCPGRVDIGREGCGHIGPKWDLTVFQ